MEWTILQFQDADRVELLRFAAEIFLEMGYPLDLEGRHSDLGKPEAEYLHSGGDFYVLRVDGCLCGSSAVRPIDKDIAELKRFYLLREYQGCGLGSKLLDRAVEHARSAGFRRLRLDTTSRSAKAIRLFEARGFYRIPRYNENPNAEFFYEKLL